LDFGVYGLELEFGIWGLWILNFGFRVWGLKFKNWGLEYSAYCLGIVYQVIRFGLFLFRVRSLWFAV
jgi:hypothetical protein